MKMTKEKDMSLRRRSTKSLISSTKKRFMIYQELKTKRIIRSYDTGLLEAKQERVLVFSLRGSQTMRRLLSSKLCRRILMRNIRMLDCLGAVLSTSSTNMRKKSLITRIKFAKISNGLK